METRGLAISLKNVLFIPHFVIVTQRGAEQTLPPRLYGQDVLPIREHDAGKRNAALVLHRISDDRERVAANLSVRNDVVGSLVVSLVDLPLGDELVDIDRVGALDLDRLKLFGLDFHVFPAGQLIAPTLVVFVDDTARLLVDHLLTKAVASLAVDLVEARLLGLARGWMNRDGAGHKREFEIAFPISTWGRHVNLRWTIVNNRKIRKSFLLLRVTVRASLVGCDRFFSANRALGPAAGWRKRRRRSCRLRRRQGGVMPATGAHTWPTLLLLAENVYLIGPKRRRSIPRVGKVDALMGSLSVFDGQNLSLTPPLALDQQIPCALRNRRTEDQRMDEGAAVIQQTAVYELCPLGGPAEPFVAVPSRSIHCRLHR